MFDYRRCLSMLNSWELQELCCDVAQACAVHIVRRDFEPDFDEPLFVKTFEETYSHTLKVLSCCEVVDEDCPF